LASQQQSNRGARCLPSEEELGILQKIGVGVVHNPQSNMNLLPVCASPEMLSAACWLGWNRWGGSELRPEHVGRDDTAASCTKSLVAIPKYCRREEAFELAPIRSAQALHLETRWLDRNGKRADIVIVERDSLNKYRSQRLFRSCLCH